MVIVIPMKMVILDGIIVINMEQTTTTYQVFREVSVKILEISFTLVNYFHDLLAFNVWLAMDYSSA